MTVDKPSTTEPTIYALDSGLSSAVPSYTSGQILHLSLTPSSPTKAILSPPILSSLAIPDGLTYDHTINTLFFTQMGDPSLPNGSICSIQPDGSNLRILIPPSNTQVHTPKQITCEPLTKKLYFSDREGMKVHRSNYDGTQLETLIQTANRHDYPTLGHGTNRTNNDLSAQRNWCVGIAVSPATEKFYWTQKGPSKSGQGRILCAGIDIPQGETYLTRTDIVTLLDGLPEPCDLEIDHTNNMLYWTDRGELPTGNSLNRIQLGDDGLPSGLSSQAVLVDRNGCSNRDERQIAKQRPLFEVVARGFHEAIGLALDVENQWVYVSDLGGSIYRIGLGLSNWMKREVVMDDYTRAWTGIVLV